MCFHAFSLFFSDLTSQDNKLTRGLSVRYVDYKNSIHFGSKTLKIKFLILLLHRADDSGLKVKVYSNNQFDLLDSTQIGLSQNWDRNTLHSLHFDIRLEYWDKISKAENHTNLSSRDTLHALHARRQSMAANSSRKKQTVSFGTKNQPPSLTGYLFFFSVFGIWR